MFSFYPSARHSTKSFSLVQNAVSGHQCHEGFRRRRGISACSLGRGGCVTFNSHFGVESHGESTGSSEAAGMGAAIRAISSKRSDGGAVLRTGTCVGARLLLLGEACRIGLGQEVIVDVRQRVAAESPVREAHARGGRDRKRRPGPFLLPCIGSGGVGAGRLPGRDSLSRRVPPARAGGTL